MAQNSPEENFLLAGTGIIVYVLHWDVRMLLSLLSLWEMEYRKGSRGSSVLKGEPVSVMSGEQVIGAEDCSYHDPGVGVRGQWEAGLESGSRMNMWATSSREDFPTNQFLFIPHSLPS